MTAGLPPDPPLDPTITPGQSGHVDDHETIAGTLALLKEAAGMTVAEIETAMGLGTAAGMTPTEVVEDAGALASLSGAFQARDLRGGSSYAGTNADALVPFRAALANRENSPVNIIVWDDSTGEGQGIGTAATDRWKAFPSVLGKILRQRFPTDGETVSAAPTLWPAATEGSLATGWTYGGTWTESNGYGPQARAKRCQVAGSTATFTTPVGTDRAELLFAAGTGITGYTVTIDGGAASATFGTTGSTRDGATYDLGALDPSTTHEIVVTTVGTNNYFDGILCYQGNYAKGIRVINGSHTGAHSDQYLPGGAFGWSKASPSPTVLSGVQSYLATPPDLLIVGMMYNDYSLTSTDITAAMHRTNVEAIIANIRATVTTKPISVLFLGKWEPNTTSATASTWADYQEAREAMAAADLYGAYLDLADLIPKPDSALSDSLSLHGDTVHGTAKSYGMVADAVASFIAP